MNFTALHNPPEYQGIKFSTADDAPALPEITKQIEGNIKRRKVEKMNRMDGVKFMFEDGSRMLMRPSGTESLVRIYAETEEDLEVLIEQGRRYLLG
jgi:phosphomannomutase